MDTFELLEQLSQKSKEEVQYGLYFLLLKGKLDFQDLSVSYVKYLEALKEDNLNKLIESESCILESFLHNKVISKESDKLKDKSNWKHTQRCLYLLNQSGRINTSSLNEKYAYDPDYAKTLSWYEQNKDV